MSDIKAIEARLAASRLAHDALQKRVQEPWREGRQPTYGELWASAMNAYQLVMDNAPADIESLLAENARLRARLVIDRAMIERAAKAYNETLYDDIRGPVERWMREVLEGALQQQSRPPSTLGPEYPEGDGALFGDK